MDGVRLSSVWCVEWRWVCAVLVRLAQWCGPCSAHPSACCRVLLSRHALLPVMSCAVVWVVSICPRSSCGGVSSVHPPLVVVVGGAVVDGGACCVMVGGMVIEGRLVLH